MAIDVKNKKTSLDEEAAIYEKRDETESGKSRWKKMNRSQKITQFKTYYLRPLIVATNHSLSTHQPFVPAGYPYNTNGTTINFYPDPISYTS